MELVTASELARIRGVSPAAVSKATNAGRIKPAKIDEKGRKLYDPEEVARAWEATQSLGKVRAHKKGGRPRKDGTPARQHPQAEPITVPGILPVDDEDEDAPDAGEEGGVNYHRAQALEKHYKAKLARLAYEEKAGTLVKIDVVAKVVEQEYNRVRARLLAIPSKLAPEVALLDDVGLCRETIEAAINDALTELSADVAAKNPGTIKSDTDDDAS